VSIQILKWFGKEAVAEGFLNQNVRNLTDSTVLIASKKPSIFLLINLLFMIELAAAWN
jgi:hypothetical protein